MRPCHDHIGVAEKKRGKCLDPCLVLVLKRAVKTSARLADALAAMADIATSRSNSLAVILDFADEGCVCSRKSEPRSLSPEHDVAQIVFDIECLW